MKLTTILSILLALAIFTIIYLVYAGSQPEPTSVPVVAKEKAPTPQQPAFRLLIHLEDPLSTLERMYGLFDGVVFNTLNLGKQHVPNYAKQLSSHPDSVLISGRDPFPLQKNTGSCKRTWRNPLF